MRNINKITKVDSIPIEKLIVYSPEQCPFRVYAFDVYGHKGDFCALLSIRTKTTFNREDCFCTEKRWIEGCPLLSKSFTVEKN